MTARLTDEQRALRASVLALSKIVQLHCKDTGGAGIKWCGLCFENWPCTTNRIATSALNKAKKGLPQ